MTERRPPRGPPRPSLAEPPAGRPRRRVDLSEGTASRRDVGPRGDDDLSEGTASRGEGPRDLSSETAPRRRSQGPGEAAAPRPASCLSLRTGLTAALLVLAALAPGPARAGVDRPKMRALLAPAPEGYVAPKLENKVSFEYPKALLDLDPRPEGRVIVKYVVGVDGVPKDLEVTQGVHPVLDAAAKDAVARLRYTPGTLKDQPIEVVLSIGLDVAAPPRPKPQPEPEPEPEPAGGGAGTDAGGDAPPAPIDAGPIRISGKILTAGLRTPVTDATVLVVPAPPDLPLGRVRQIVDDTEVPAWTARATTDQDGAFAVRGVPTGRVRIIVVTQSYERLDEVVELPKNERIEVTYYQKQLTFNPYKTVVKAQRDDSGEVNRRTISLQEINALPGTQGDALKAIQNFPGVARAPFGAGLLAIRGAAPGDSATYLAYHEIPQLFHFGGLTSVFNSDILTQIDFIPGNFDSRYGDAIGGVINVTPRQGRRDGYHGYVDADLFDSGILAEGPVGKGSLILSGRRSYIDFVLANAIPDDAGLNLTVAPRYYDYQVIFDYPISGGDFTARIFGSDDRTTLVFKNENEMEVDDRNRFETINFFHRGDLSYRKSAGGWDFLITPSYRRDYASFTLSDFARFGLTSDGLSARAEVARQLVKNANLRVGTEFVGFFYTFDITAPNIDFQQTTTRGKGNLLYPALYTTMAIGLGERLTLFPGARLTYYGAPFNRATVDPRLRFNLDVADNTQIKGGVGLYTQAPNPPFKFDAVFGNPRIGPERAVHGSLGVAHQFERDISLEVTGFYKYLWDLSAPSTTLAFGDDGPRPELWANTGVGHILGGELLFRKALTRNLFGWLSYTLMRSTRRDVPGEDFYLFDFDQTHILTAIASYKLPRGWQVGARFRLVSGNPTTPVIGAVYDADSGTYISLTGPRNSARVPAFHQLDLRVDRRWVYKRITTTAYLDVLNVYNAQNTEFINYSYNYQQSNKITSLPILPSIGVKIEW